MAKSTPTPWTRPAQRQVTGKPVARPARTADVQAYIPELARGMAITMRHFFKNTKELILGQKPDPVLEGMEDGITTISYPEEKRPYPSRFRGLHRLTLRDDGSPRCVACLCCSTACPAQCISIKPAEYAEGDPRRGYERFPETFVIDELRCIFCGYCVESLPLRRHLRMDTGHARRHPTTRATSSSTRRTSSSTSTGREGERPTRRTRATSPSDPTHPGVTREHEAH